jgi:hypothetical protein
MQKSKLQFVELDLIFDFNILFFGFICWDDVAVIGGVAFFFVKVARSFY